MGLVIAKELLIANSHGFRMVGFVIGNFSPVIHPLQYRCCKKNSLQKLTENLSDAAAATIVPLGKPPRPPVREGSGPHINPLPPPPPPSAAIDSLHKPPKPPVRKGSGPLIYPLPLPPPPLPSVLM
ncbi:Uncharacterized protein TCM_031709 [Theobroma cacao]|uniref:Uncharacterized protein n=1 Tax=Theobroma cacao TaxID=3641 RepID=A0A061F937_THECC|nr:Uncharacterized protein TCM_031709 [Theobroma cacao]